jgi:hypothetical protein
MPQLRGNEPILGLNNQRKQETHNKPNQILLMGFKVRSTQNQNSKRKLFRK